MKMYSKSGDEVEVDAGQVSVMESAGFLRKKPSAQASSEDGAPEKQTWTCADCDHVHTRKSEPKKCKGEDCSGTTFISNTAE